jgi:hypothetical protein
MERESVEYDTAWLEEVRRVTREGRSQVDERYAAVLARGVECLIDNVFPLLAGMVEALIREGIVVSVETRMNRQDGARSNGPLESVPGGVISTRLQNGEAGPALTIWVGLTEVPKGRLFPRVVVRGGDVEGDVYSEDTERTAAETRRIILAFAAQVAEADRRSGLERKTLERITRNFPRES